jgi:hypothetical protein
MYTEVHGGVMHKQSAVSQHRENRVPVTVGRRANSRTASWMRCIFSGMSKRAQANFRWICRCSSWVATRCCVSYIAGQRRERSFPLWTTARPRSRISLCVKNKTVCNNNCYSHALLFSMSATISPSPTIYATLF